MQEIFYCKSRLISTFLQVTFPYCNDIPSQFNQGFLLFYIPFYIAVNHVQPEFSPGFRYNKMPAVLMPMPEAAVNKNNGVVFFKDDIRFAGQFFIVNAVSETFCKKLLTEQYFRLCIGAPDPAHIEAALRGGMSVCHQKKISTWPVSRKLCYPYKDSSKKQILF